MSKPSGAASRSPWVTFVATAYWVLIYLLALLVLATVIAAVTNSLAAGIGWPTAIAISAVVFGLLIFLYARRESVFRHRQTILIDRPLPAVFALLGEGYFANRHKWSRISSPEIEVLESEYPPVDEMRPGATAREVLREGKRQAEWRYEVVEYDPPRKLAVRAVSVPESFPIDSSFTFAESRDGTRMIMSAEIRLKPLWGLIRPWWALAWEDRYVRGGEAVRKVAHEEIAPTRVVA